MCVYSGIYGDDSSAAARALKKSLETEVANGNPERSRSATSRRKYGFNRGDRRELIIQLVESRVIIINRVNSS